VNQQTSDRTAPEAIAAMKIAAAQRAIVGAIAAIRDPDDADQAAALAALEAAQDALDEANSLLS
jgi:hypothetical protein